MRFLRAFSFPAKAFGLSRAPWETRFAKRERRESISFFAHIFSTNIFLDRNERFVHLASISSYARRKRRMNHALHLATKFDSFSLEQTKKQEKKKNQHFPRERQREEHTLVLRDFAGVPTKFATCAVLRDVDAENIFYSRVACARFLPNFDGHDTTKRKRSKKGETEKTHLFSLIFCFFVFSALFCLNHTSESLLCFCTRRVINLHTTTEKERV